MSELETIESQVERLDAKSFAAFRAWMWIGSHADYDKLVG